MVLGPKVQQLANCDGSQTDLTILMDQCASVSLAPGAPTDVSGSRRCSRLCLCRRGRLREGSPRLEARSAWPCRVCSRGDGLRRPLPQRGGRRVDGDRQRRCFCGEERIAPPGPEKRQGRQRARHSSRMSAATRPGSPFPTGCAFAETAFAVLCRSGVVVASMAIGRGGVFRGQERIAPPGPEKRLGRHQVRHSSGV